MKKFIYCLLGALIVSFPLSAQDEGSVVKKERIDRNKGIFLGVGPSFTLGKNIGDYKTGFNFEIGFVKRVNRILSIGPSVSYINFKYDPEQTSANGGGAYIGYGDPNDWEDEYGIDDLEYDYGYILELKGGDLSMISLALNLKMNFIPVRDDSKISIYAFARPFVTMASRSEVSGSDERYVYELYEEDDILWYEEEEWFADGTTSEWGASSYPALEEKNQVTGGIFVGPGIEIMPAKPFSVFVQASFGYTFPISYVSTKSYDPTVESYVDNEFPMTKKGFPSVNLQAGFTFNF
jgi:hypothetical protein